jgi:mannose-6-phosphate isomerase-like protein (cupin superfamily)
MKIWDTRLVHADSRGRLVNLISAGSWREVNHIWTAAGVRRGGHYHSHTRELFYILAGKIRAEIVNPATAERTVLQLEPGMVVEIEPNEVHTLETETEAQWLNFLSEPLDEHSPDIHRAEQRG